MASANVALALAGGCGADGGGGEEWLLIGEEGGRQSGGGRTATGIEAPVWWWEWWEGGADRRRGRPAFCGRVTDGGVRVTWAGAWRLAPGGCDSCTAPAGRQATVGQRGRSRLP